MKTDRNTDTFAVPADDREAVLLDDILQELKRQNDLLESIAEGEVSR